MFLLDTDTIIYSLKGHTNVVKNLRLHIADPIKISAVTLIESNLAKIKTLENSMEIIPIGKESVEIFGIYKANLEKAGTPLDDFDLILASCALSTNLILVTNNVKHFERIDGLKITNWTKY